MSIETLDDIIEELADKFGIYGAHSEKCETQKPCRVCWTAQLNGRINYAVEIESDLAGGRDARLKKIRRERVANQTGLVCVYPIGNTTCGYTAANHFMANGAPMHHNFTPASTVERTQSDVSPKPNEANTVSLPEVRDAQ